MKIALFLLAILLAPLGFAVDVGIGPSPAGSQVYSGGAVPATTQVVYSNGSSLAGDSAWVRSALVLTIDPNTDNTFTTGYGKLGLATSGTSTQWYLAQASNYTSSSYALSQNAAGATFLNAATGQTLALRINNNNKFTVTTSAANFPSGVPLTDADTTDATSKTTGAIISSGGASAAKNMIAGQGVHAGVASTATAAGTTTLTNASAQVQIFTGATTQTVQLPLGNVLGAGISVHYVLINRSTGSVSWARAGSDTINGATSNVAVTTLTAGEIYSDGVSAWYTK